MRVFAIYKRCWLALPLHHFVPGDFQILLDRCQVSTTADKRLRSCQTRFWLVHKYNFFSERVLRGMSRSTEPTISIRLGGARHLRIQTTRYKQSSDRLSRFYNNWKISVRTRSVNSSSIFFLRIFPGSKKRYMPQFNVQTFHLEFTMNPRFFSHSLFLYPLRSFLFIAGTLQEFY